MSSLPTLYREDLHWHEQPHWFLLSVVCCAAGALSLGVGLLTLIKHRALVWLMFLCVMGGLAFGGALGQRYLSVTQTLWTTRRGAYRPMWRLATGRAVFIELFAGWTLVTLVGWRFGREIVSVRSIFGFPRQEAWFIGVCLGIQFGLWSGVALMWPVYQWIRNLPNRPSSD